MKIWVDADACPGVIKEILFRAAMRTNTLTILVANQTLRVPSSPWVRSLQVPSGFDEADRRIASEVNPGDLVITADIPLAAQVIEKGATVLDTRGDLMDERNIRERLSMRDFMEGLRNTGVDTGGPNAFSATDRQRFANSLDRILARRPATDRRQPG